MTGTARYGRTIRTKVDAVLREKNALHECLKCGKKKVKRKSNAIWKCSSCGATFAGGAYTPYTDTGKAARKAVERS